MIERELQHLFATKSKKKKKQILYNIFFLFELSKQFSFSAILFYFFRFSSFFNIISEVIDFVIYSNCWSEIFWEQINIKTNKGKEKEIATKWKIMSRKDIV